MLNAAEIKNLQQRLSDEDCQDAFGQLYMAFMHRLLQFASSIIKNHELAEEIVSDVFIRIWQNRKQAFKIENFKLYLYVSTRNTALNYLSRHYRKQELSIDDMSMNLSTLSYNPEELLITSEAVRKIENEIQKLPPRCKLIFKLVKEDGLKYNDIAQLLNISVKTIDSQMAIAVKKIGNAIKFELNKAPGRPC